MPKTKKHASKRKSKSNKIVPLRDNDELDIEYIGRDGQIKERNINKYTSNELGIERIETTNKQASQGKLWRNILIIYAILLILFVLYILNIENSQYIIHYVIGVFILIFLVIILISDGEDTPTPQDKKKRDLEIIELDMGPLCGTPFLNKRYEEEKRRKDAEKKARPTNPYEEIIDQTWPRKSPTEEPAPDVKKAKTCAICKEILTLTTGHKCKYCKKFHCSDHMQPEKHKCPNPKKPKGFTSTIISDRTKKKK